MYERARSSGMKAQGAYPEHPSESTDGGREVGDDASLNGAEVGGEGRTAVETEPTEPQQDRAKNDVGCVVGLVRESLGAIASALTEVDGNRECGSARRDVDGRAAGEVEATHDERPTVRVPRPAGNRVVDYRRPNEGEDDGWPETSTFRNSTERDHWSDGREHELEDAEGNGWDTRAADGRLFEDTLETEVLWLRGHECPRRVPQVERLTEITNVLVTSFAER